MKFDDLDDKMRVYEKALDQCIVPGMYMIARLDGRSFTRLTKEICKFEAPFDDKFRDMMVETVKYLMKDSGLQIVYGYIGGNIPKMDGILRRRKLSRQREELSRLTWNSL